MKPQIKLPNKCLLKNFQNYSDVTKNLLFLPGGAGIESDYLKNLGLRLKIPSNLWTFDYPIEETFYEGCFFQWGDDFLNACKLLNNPIVIGHSFGGCLIMAQKEIFSYVNGVILLNSTTSGEDFAESVRNSQLIDLDDSQAFEKYENCKSDQNLRKLFKAWIPYYFLRNNFIIGEKIFDENSFNYLAYEKSKNELNSYCFNWTKIIKPILILSGEFDLLCPLRTFDKYDIFLNSKFVMKKIIKNSGHFSWLENFHDFEKEFKSFIDHVTSIT